MTIGAPICLEIVLSVNHDESTRGDLSLSTRNFLSSKFDPRWDDFDFSFAKGDQMKVAEISIPLIVALKPRGSTFKSPPVDAESSGRKTAGLAATFPEDGDGRISESSERS